MNPRTCCESLDSSEPLQSSFSSQSRHADFESRSYLASPEVVAASALAGRIVGTGWYQKREGASGVLLGEGDGIKEEDRMITAEEALEKVIGQLEDVIEKAESETEIAPQDKTPKEIEILDGFPSILEGELVFCDADNINVSYHLLSSFLIPVHNKHGDTFRKLLHSRVTHERGPVNCSLLKERADPRDVDRCDIPRVSPCFRHVQLQDQC